MKKTYISTTGTQITFPVVIAGKAKFLSLNGAKNDMTTDKVAVQNAIESHKRFLSGEIELLHGEPNEKPVMKEETPKADVLPPIEPVETQKDETPVTDTVEEVKAPVEPVEETKEVVPEVTKDETPVQETIEPQSNIYPDVTNFQEAAEVLKKQYSVMHQSVRTPEGIAKKAKELGVQFPNLK